MVCSFELKNIQYKVIQDQLSPQLVQAANVVLRAEMDGLKKYSPPRGVTNCCFGKASEDATFSGSMPVTDLGSLISCPIYFVVSGKRRCIE